MKNFKSPTIIHLNELPEDGRAFKFTRQSGELNDDLSDIIGTNDYEISFYIRPIGNAYEMTGKFSVTMDLICSRCAVDFNTNIKEEFNEIIIVNDALPRNAQSSKTNHSSEWEQDGPYCNQIESNEFRIGKFTHEIIALAEPMQPLGKENCDNTCENYIKALNEGWLANPDDDAREKETPFAVLEQLKLT